MTVRGVTMTEASAGLPATNSLWQRITANRTGMIGLAIVLTMFVVALAFWSGLVAGNWSQVTAAPWAAPSADHWLGTNRVGQDILSRAVAGTATAFSVGVPVAMASTLLGALLGGLAGWNRNGWLDEILSWITGVMDSIPFFLFVAAVAYAMQGHPWAMQIAMIATFWTTTARLVRAEVIRLEGRAFVDAARVLGLGELRILLRHVLPNTSHILLVQFAIAFVASIKAEVVLSFLGIGVKGGVSWGLMLAESTGEVLAGNFGNFLAASACLFTLLLGFNLLTDALQDAGDPHGGGAGA